MEPYIKIGEWYYPVQGVMFHLFPDGIALFEVGMAEDANATATFVGKQAVHLKKCLDELSIDLTYHEEGD